MKVYSLMINVLTYRKQIVSWD